MGRCFNFITAKAKRIKAVLKTMLKLVFPKVAKAQTIVSVISTNNGV